MKTLKHFVRIIHRSANFFKKLVKFDIILACKCVYVRPEHKAKREPYKIEF